MTLDTTRQEEIKYAKGLTREALEIAYVREAINAHGLLRRISELKQKCSDMNHKICEIHKRNIDDVDKAYQLVTKVLDTTQKVKTRRRRASSQH